MIFTIGHGKLPGERFVELLKEHHIQLVVDVRTKPFSRFSPQFNKNPFSVSLERRGFMYIWRGRDLGGLYEVEGSLFNAGIESLLEIDEKKNFVLMCAETDHKKCHRFYKLTKALKLKGRTVYHINHDGSLVKDATVQPGLFS